MRKIISAALVFINGTSIYGSYADASEYSVGSFTYGEKDVKAVEINWVGGEIDIVQGENDTLSVTENGEGLDSEEQMHHYIRDGKLIIHYCESGHRGVIDTASKKLRVEIPAGVHLDIDNVSADITLGTVNVGEFDLTNVSGDVAFAGINATDIEIDIVSGSISAESISARAFSAEGVSGDIDVKKISADEIDVDIVSGKTNFVLEKACEIDISGVSGEVSVTLPEGVGALVEYDSVSGDLHSDMAHTKNGDTYTFGAGEIKINIETVSGNLYIQ